MKKTVKHSLALLLTGALLAGLLPVAAGTKSQAAEQPTLKNPRLLKTTQEVAPEAGSRKEPKNPTAENGITTWDCIWFGNYWQEDTNGDGKVDKKDKKTPIKWRVLSVDGDDAFLVADKNLNGQYYDITGKYVTWETCTMRSWLNGYGAEKNEYGKDYSNDNFLNNAFSADEQSAITTMNVVNNDNPEYGTEGGNDTADKVYLLSLDEVVNPAYGFVSDDSNSATRVAANTAYTAGRAPYMSSAGKADYWWLRSPGGSSLSASIVSYDGSVHAYGNDAYRNDHAVRPALHLNLKASSDAVSVTSWSYAGSVPSDEVTEWDCIWFGNYWQEDTNGDGKADKNDEKTPIKWWVLSVEGDDAFLVADKNLDCKRYNDTVTEVTWETCTMRSWLNGYGAESNKDEKDYSNNNFLNNAFSTDEQSAIRTTNVVNNGNYGTEYGNDTVDKVYLLSLDEVMNPTYGFASHDSTSQTREAVNTAYTAGGGEIGYEGMGSAEKAGYWWLRSPGHYSDDASTVNGIGYVDAYGDVVHVNRNAVRPALHLNLKASPDAISATGWSYAGSVISEREESETPTPSATASPTADVTATPDVTASPTADVTEEVAPEAGSKKLPKNPTMEKGITTWDCIWFGNYWQEDTNGDGKVDKKDKKTPIKWRVLSIDGDDAFLVADKNLDCQRYNDMRTEVTWETCTMRSWLNGYGAESNKDGKDYSGNNFLNNAFSADEQSAITTTNVVNNDNPEYETRGGNDTTDKVYLLSLDEVKNPVYGFASGDGSSATRKTVNTAYTAGGGEIGSNWMSNAGKAENWWLRSQGDDSSRASGVDYDGYVDADGDYVRYSYNAVRPALRLNLKVSPDAISVTGWSYAGSVISERKESETVTPTPEVTATPTPDVTASPTADVTATPDGIASPTADVTATPTPDGTASPTANVTATPTPDGTATPTADVTAPPTPNGTTSQKPTNKPDSTGSLKPTDEPQTNTANSAAEGTVLEDSENHVSYKVLAQGAQVAFCQENNKKATKVVVPDTVTIKGTTYKVTAISDNALGGCKKLKSVTIGKSVATIGNKAFSKCTSLKKITIPSGVTKIGKKAFYGCKKLKSITIKSKKLKSKSVGAQAFKGLHKKAVIKVPKKQKKAYTKWLRKKGITKKMKIK